MGFLNDRIAEITGVSSEQGLYDVAYSTGFLNFDYINGYRLPTYDIGGNRMDIPLAGIIDGSYNLVIGRSGSGKTTFAVQAAANIIRQFKESDMRIYSIEGGVTVPRLELLTGFIGQELFNRCAIKNSGITTDSLGADIMYIHKEKTENKERFQYDTGLTDSKGNPIIKYVPTVIVLDSITSLAPKSVVDREGLGGQMDATAMAKANTSFLKRTIQLMKESNIILLAVSHITTKIETNAFVHTKTDLKYLKQGESISGGKAVVYYANNIIRFDDGTLKEETFGFPGSIVKTSLGKSRSNKAGKETPLIFSQDFGFDPILSLAYMAKETGIIDGKGAYNSIDGYANKFTMKKFKDLWLEDPEFKIAFLKAVRPSLESLLAPTATAAENVNTSVTQDLIDSFRNLL